MGNGRPNVPKGKESRPMEHSRTCAGEGPGLELPLKGDCFEKPKMEYWSAGVME